VAIREDNKQSTTIQKVPKPEEVRLLVHWGGQNSTTDKDNSKDKKKATKGEVTAECTAGSDMSTRKKRPLSASNMPTRKKRPLSAPGASCRTR
jgi:hypothetical protein